MTEEQMKYVGLIETVLSGDKICQEIAKAEKHFDWPKVEALLEIQSHRVKLLRALQKVEDYDRDGFIVDMEE